MSVSRNRRSPRRGKLTPDERRLVEDIAESGRAFGMWPGVPGMIPVDLAVRAAERAYRRGVVQGAHYMLWHLRPETRSQYSHPMFLGRLNRWRSRGTTQEHAIAELPPPWDSPCRWTR
jgi:hypothetical protein